MGIALYMPFLSSSYLNNSLRKIIIWLISSIKSEIFYIFGNFFIVLLRIGNFLSPPVFHPDNFFL